MGKIIVMVIAALTALSVNAKTLVYNSQQWSIIKMQRAGLLNGIDVKPSQVIRLDVSEEGQIVNLSVFDEDAMSKAMVDEQMAL